ncbi:MAG: hypothetical protein ACI4UF_05555, partial [Thermoguttaceae bacterium]
MKHGTPPESEPIHELDLHFVGPEKKNAQIRGTRNSIPPKTPEAATGPADEADEADLNGLDFK